MSCFVQPGWSVTVLYNVLWYFFSQIYLNLWFVSKITGMWIWVFHCFNKLQHHKLIAMLAICCFTIPLYPPGLIYSTYSFFSKVISILPRGHSTWETGLSHPLLRTALLLCQEINLRQSVLPRLENQLLNLSDISMH